MKKFEHQIPQMWSSPIKMAGGFFQPCAMLVWKNRSGKQPFFFHSLRAEVSLQLGRREEFLCNLRLEEASWFSPDRRMAVRRVRQNVADGEERRSKWRSKWRDMLHKATPLYIIKIIYIMWYRYMFNRAFWTDPPNPPCFA